MCTNLETINIKPAENLNELIEAGNKGTKEVFNLVVDQDDVLPPLLILQEVLLMAK